MTTARAASGRMLKCWPVRKEPRGMTAGQINRELDGLDARGSQICTEMIDAGRGHERPTETHTKSDPLSLSYIAVASRQSELRIEIELRYGPGAPPRLPLRGFGPRKL